MPIDPSVKKTWIEAQKKSPVPVNAIGAKIESKDENALRIWREEGIDQFLRK